MRRVPIVAVGLCTLAVPVGAKKPDSPPGKSSDTFDTDDYDWRDGNPDNYVIFAHEGELVTITSGLNGHPPRSREA